MKRAVIIVKGNVQRVGYRDRVENIARKLGVVGFVENLKPYDIRIITEGKKENLEKFIQQIKIEESPILVEKVEARLEEPTHEFEYFEIKRGDWKEELGERFDVAGKLLYRSVTFGEKSVALGEKSVELGETSVNIGKEALGMQREMLGKQDQMLEKRDETVNILKQSNQEMKEFRQDTMQRFDIIDTKYGKIAENMEKAIEAINRTCINTERLLEKTERDRKDFRDAIEKLADAIISKK